MAQAQRGSGTDDSCASKAALELREFLNESVGSPLRAWLWHFDADHDHRITAMEFARVLRHLGYPKDPAVAFAALDDDRSGELSLQELDPDQATLWRQFRDWCAKTFEGSSHMVQTLISHWMSKKGRRSKIGTDLSKGPGSLTYERFTEGMSIAGWTGGSLELLFSCFTLDGQDFITVQGLKWLDIERRRQQRKDEAKQRAMSLKKPSTFNHEAAKAVLKTFKLFLKRTYGSFIRAWRVALSPSDSMVLPKAHFCKACSEIGFRNEAKLLWQGFGKDDTALLSIDDLDNRSGILLARFQAFVSNTFGGALAAFQALDKLKTRMLRKQDFCAALAKFGCHLPGRQLFHGLDRHGRDCLVESDILFLDRWKPPAFLLASPNHAALEELKALFIAVYDGYVKAWRKTIDLRNSNRCDWNDFRDACKKLTFAGDIPGAWRALDSGYTGFISLHDIDHSSGEALDAFRTWATQEFGSVASAFGVFDMDGSNSLSMREFNRACRIYGFGGHASSLFRTLDIERDGNLSLKEVAFLDGWIDDLAGEAEEEPERPRLQRGSTSLPHGFKRSATSTEAEPLQPEPESAPETEHRPRTSLMLSSSLRRPRQDLPSERVWWTDLPCAPSPPRSACRAATPRISAWCKLCQSRNPCRHFTGGSLSARGPPSSLQLASLAALASPRPPRRPHTSYEPFAPKLSAWSPAVGSEASVLSTAVVPAQSRKHTPGTEVQVLALARYPMGSLFAPALEGPWASAESVPGS
mmetsp:Transcript_31720/g.91082  ORF Transcript_31720/g.91082 Transcript_31720/m.91082 type:complete len:752 (+) Transcript_31720:136-2391(+)